jgi:hypothetical protein
MPPKQKAKIVKDVTQLVLARRTRMCNFIEYKGPISFLHHPERTFSLIATAFVRYKGRISAIRIPVLCNGHRPVGQRTRHAGDNPQICRSSGSIFWECASIRYLLSHWSHENFVRFASWICGCFSDAVVVTDFFFTGSLIFKRHSR